MNALKFIRRIFVVSGAVFCSGCAGLSFQQAPVAFDDPAQLLHIKKVEPSEKEIQEGVLLEERFMDRQELVYLGENRIYANVQDGKGIQLDLKMKRTERLVRTEDSNVYRLIAETEIEKDGGKLYEEILIDPRGEIKKFVKGFHRSKIGKFEITDWSRTALFPDSPVRVDDRWNYNEIMGLRTDSFWIKQLESAPQKMTAQCELEGFAEVRGVRTAVIKKLSRLEQIQKFKIFFKEIHFSIKSEMEERVYWDYQNGRLVASVIRTRSWTEGINLPLNDYGESQSILELQAEPVLNEKQT